MNDQIPDSHKQLKALRPWQMFIVPPVLLLVAINTFLRDRIFTLLLPRKRYGQFSFEAHKESLPSKNEKIAS